MSFLTHLANLRPLVNKKTPKAHIYVLMKFQPPCKCSLVPIQDKQFIANMSHGICHSQHKNTCRWTCAKPHTISECACLFSKCNNKFRTGITVVTVYNCKQRILVLLSIDKWELLQKYYFNLGVGKILTPNISLAEW